MYAILMLSGINNFMNFFFVIATAVYQWRTKDLAKWRKTGCLGVQHAAANRFLRFSRKKHSFKHTFCRKKTNRTSLPAASAVSNNQYKNISAGLSKGLGMSKSRSLAKTHHENNEAWLK